jgi:hypothetical protein
MEDAHDKRAGEMMEGSTYAKRVNACKIIEIFIKCNGIVGGEIIVNTRRTVIFKD